MSCCFTSVAEVEPVPGSLLSYVQTDATLLSLCCVLLHVAKSLTGFKFCATTPNNSQQHATGFANLSGDGRLKKKKSVE